MSLLEIPIWRHAPFIRLFPPLVVGILLGYYIEVSIIISWIIFASCTILLPFFVLFSSTFQYRYYPITGAIIYTWLMCTGCLLIYYQDITHHNDWFGHQLPEGPELMVTLQEPLTVKNKSYKVIASVRYLVSGKAIKPVKGKLIIYFEKIQATKHLQAGYDIRFSKQPVRIRGSGNPGAFDYSKYMAFQGIYYQVYLTSNEFKVIREGKPSAWKQFIFNTRDEVLIILRKYITSKQACGLAEALLIGYKDDLDKMLLQSYSNTGVVHVIAISGLHLGLIYWLLALLLKPFSRGKRSRIARLIIIITGLWIFSFLAGASPSVLRSALMFSFIVVGESGGRKASIYNSLAASAFLLISYNPFWIWDAGFQLSYIAVLSLVVFMKPVYNCMFVKNKLLDNVWNLTSVTLAAQVLTFPLCIYLFHQFPNLFLLTNLVAIPLSGLILLGEIGLCLVSYFKIIADPLGHSLQFLILFMNRFVQHVEQLPFSAIKKIQISFQDMLFVYIIIIALSIGIYYRNKAACLSGLGLLALLACLQTVKYYHSSQHQKLVVYNMKGKGIEIINGRASLFLTDVSALKDETMAQFVLTPSQINLHVQKRKYLVSAPVNLCLSLRGKKVMVISTPLKRASPGNTDIVILTGNPKMELRELREQLAFKTIVFDGTNNFFYVKRWTTYCRASKISYWNVAEKGAFILKLN